ncbi:MAG: hypothetical protein MRJ68_04285 [Nitrospira sp.]|nr:hypothetical protein [Nitrospira sp.]
MMKKCRDPVDYAVMPLEGLWWADDLSAFVANDRARWKWTMMIMQPSFVTEAVIKTAMVDVAKKKALPVLSNLRLETFKEGVCARSAAHRAIFTGGADDRKGASVHSRSRQAHRQTS